MRFAPDCILDVHDVYSCLCLEYDVGYAGLYSCDVGSTVYVQTANRGVRMVPAKVARICQPLGAVSEDPQTFRETQGVLVAQIGTLRHVGRKRKKPNANPSRVNAGAVHLCVTPFGGEDVSHITVDQFKALIGGEEEKIEFIRSNMNAAAYQNLVQYIWEEFRDKVLDIESITDLRQTKAEVERIAVLSESARLASYNLPYEFAGLLYSNLRNNNVMHSMKDGHLRYWSGSGWVRIPVGDIGTITEGWEKKVSETFDVLARQCGPSFTESFEAKYASRVIKMFRDREPATESCARFLFSVVKRESLGVIHKMNSRLRDAQVRTGKRVTRVGENGGETGVVYVTTWEDLEAS